MSQLLIKPEKFENNLFSKNFSRIHKVFRYLGHSTFTIKTQSGTIRKSPILFGSSLICPIILVYASIYYSIHVLHYYSFIDNSVVALSMVIYYIIIIESIMKTDQQILIIDQFNDIDRIFYQKFGYLIKCKKFWSIAFNCFGLFLFTVTCWSIIIGYAYWYKSYLVYYLTTASALICVSFHLTLCKIYMDHLKIRLSALCEVMESTLAEKDVVDFNSYRLNCSILSIEKQINHPNHNAIMLNCKNLYTKLLNVCQAINNCMGISFLLSIVFTFLTTPACLFWYYGDFYSGDIDSDSDSMVCKYLFVYS